jgi:kumamolisin
MDPDVSLNADDVNSPYAIYAASLGGWIPVGGTSCAAPLWAAFIALVNEKRLANGMQNLGFANTAIYSIAQGSLYASTFHDVADNSNNLYYHAVSGYDMATGWGSFNGQSLFSALTSSVLPPSPPVGFAVEAVTTP